MSTTVRRQNGGDIRERVKSFREMEVFEFEGLTKSKKPTLPCTGKEKQCWRLDASAKATQLVIVLFYIPSFWLCALPIDRADGDKLSGANEQASHFTPSPKLKAEGKEIRKELKCVLWVNEVFYGTLYGSDDNVTTLCCNNTMSLPLLLVPQVPCTLVSTLCQDDWGRELIGMPLPHEKVWASRILRLVVA